MVPVVKVVTLTAADVEAMLGQILRALLHASSNDG